MHHRIVHRAPHGRQTVRPVSFHRKQLPEWVTEFYLTDPLFYMHHAVSDRLSKVGQVGAKAIAISITDG